jgi:hypothetical protein
MRAPVRWLAVTALLSVAGCAGEPVQPPAGEPHGELWVLNPSPVIKNVLPVRVLAVDGRKVLSGLPRVRMRPGRHQVLLLIGAHETGPADSHVIPRGGETPGLLVIDVEAGKRYHLAGQAQSSVGRRWTPIVWKVTDLPGGSAP